MCVLHYVCVCVCACRTQESVTSSFKKEIDEIIRTDPLTKLTSPQMELLWKFRKYCSTIPEALPKVKSSH